MTVHVIGVTAEPLEATSQSIKELKNSIKEHNAAIKDLEAKRNMDLLLLSVEELVLRVQIAVTEAIARHNQEVTVTVSMPENNTKLSKRELHEMIESKIKQFGHRLCSSVTIGLEDGEGSVSFHW